MSLLGLQTVLARLYTDSAFRARFFDNPGETCHGITLTENEQRQLAALDREQVERFARSLQQKRLSAVRELLPATARVMGNRFAACFFHYCETQPSAPGRVDEARAFARCLLDSTGDQRLDSILPSYLAELITCEWLCLDVLYPPGPSPGVESPVCTDETHRHGFNQGSRHTGEAGANSLRSGPRDETPKRTAETPLDARPWLTARAHVAAFRYDVEALYPRVMDGEVVEAQPDPCHVLIGKVRGAMRARLKRLNAATARLLMGCDGRRKLGQIVEEVAAGLRLNDAERRLFGVECARFLAPLVQNELIGLSPPEAKDGGVSEPIDQS